MTGSDPPISPMLLITRARIFGSGSPSPGSRALVAPFLGPATDGGDYIPLSEKTRDVTNSHKKYATTQYTLDDFGRYIFLGASPCIHSKKTTKTK